MALVLTLLILTLLVVTGLELHRAVRVEATLAGNFRDLTQARYIAQSGVEIARALIQGDDPAYDGLDERWAQFQSLASLSQGLFPEGHFTGRVEDENAKFNPNGLIDLFGIVDQKKKNQLERLCALLGYPAEWIDALLDWLDADDQKRPLGAEGEYYQTHKTPHRAKNGPLDFLGEMLLIKGVDASLFEGQEGREGLKNYLTVFSDGRININTASLAVLMSLSPQIDQAMARAVLDYRQEKAFRQTEDLRSLPGWEAVYPLISSEITVRTNYFSVEIWGNFREARAKVHTMIRRDGPRTRVLFWEAG